MKRYWTAWHIWELSFLSILDAHVVFVFLFIPFFRSRNVYVTASSSVMAAFLWFW